MKYLLKSILIIFLFTFVNFAGGWTQKKGSGFYKLDFRYLPGKAVYNDDGEKFNLTIKDISLGFYGEYGITNSLTLFANWLPFQKIDSTSNLNSGLMNEISGVSDGGVGLRYLLHNFGSSVLSGVARLNIPIGETETDGNLWLGTGEWNQTVGLEFGHSFYPIPIYTILNLYYRNKSEGFSDELIWGIEAGYLFNKNLAVSGKFHGLNTLNNGDKNKFGGFAIYSNNQKYFAYGIQLIYKPNSGIGFTAGYESGGGGRNIISAPVISTGVFLTH